MARITRVERAASATFAIVEAEPTARLALDREVLLVWFREEPQAEPSPQADATAQTEPPTAAAADEAAR